MNEGPERIDYQETPDVTEVHAAVKREHSEPSADVTPIPLWLTGLCGAAIAWAGAYFGVFHGGFSGNVYNEYASSPIILFPLPQKEGPAGEAAQVSLAQQGKKIYSSNCQSCHQANGNGVPGQFPALAKSEWVIGGEKRLLAILLKGVKGPITVHGTVGTYGGNMAPWESTMTPKNIAAVASYIRSDWGNTAPEVTVEDVDVAKKEFAAQKDQWTEAQLKEIPDTNYEGSGAAPAPAASAAAPATTAPAPAAADGTFDLKASIERGKPIYTQTCVACHQPTGLGLPGAFPPLGESEYVTENPRRLVAILAKGVQGPLVVKGVTYNNVMLALDMQFPILKDDAKLADVANYVRNSFGNTTTEPITPALVTEVRKEFATKATPWTEAELKAFPAATK